jgi:hypothetical protein
MGVSGDSAKSGETRSSAEEEIARLKDKRSASHDPDIVAALDARIAQLEELHPPRALETQPDSEPQPPVEPIEEPAPEDIERAEALIRQSRVERMRGNRKAASDLLEQAAALAPTSSAIAEALGDDLAERGQVAAALDKYAIALKHDSTNVGLERKYAEMVLRTKSAGSIEDQLRAGLSDSLFLTSTDSIAGLSAARWLSAIVPGVGQLTLGRTAKGLWMLGGWVVCMVLTVVFNHDFLRAAMPNRASSCCCPFSSASSYGSRRSQTSREARPPAGKRSSARSRPWTCPTSETRVFPASPEARARAHFGSMLR